jgi:RND family efflux transporter MFP subunit
VAGLLYLSFGFRGLPPATEVLAHDAPKTKKQVEFIHPQKGGLIRSSSQPGTAHSYESADLYPKISGFVKKLHVDIGSVVKEGDILAEIDVPEVLQDVLIAESVLNQAEAEVAQSEAQIECVVADQRAFEAKVMEAISQRDRTKSEVSLHEKQLARIQGLNDLNAIEDRLVDEKMQQLHSASANLQAAQSTIVAAEQDLLAAKAKISLSRAQLNVAKAKVSMAKSQLERCRVMATYTQIVSPYDGVITARNYHRGAYVRSPDHGGDKAIVSVDRTDLMRVVVRIPERDVPYVHQGDMCQIVFDAFPKQQFKAPVARIAATQDAATRTMAVEIDLENQDGFIRDHMYGRVLVTLEDANEGFTIPSTCLVGDSANGKAKVFVVLDGKISPKEIGIGRDTGLDTEVLSGLSSFDKVVMRPANGITEGMEVDAVPLTPTNKSH